jgi:hypothetical protein
VELDQPPTLLDERDHITGGDVSVVKVALSPEIEKLLLDLGQRPPKATC